MDFQGQISKEVKMLSKTKKISNDRFYQTKNLFPAQQGLLLKLKNWQRDPLEFKINICSTLS